MLGSSPFWSSRVYLKWKSKRLSFFVRTVSSRQTAPSSGYSEESLEALFQKSDQQDMYFRNSKTAHQSFCVFQLAPSMPHTAGTGSGLLPTPATVQIGRISIDTQTMELTERTGRDGSTKQRSIIDALIVIAAEHGLIPTVTAMDSTTATARMKSSQVKDGSMHSLTLGRLVAMLPTPVARDWKGPQAKQYRGKEGSLPGTLKFLAGMHGPLSPRFLAEMMGFPFNWTELPFQNGAQKA
ncbi:hypothetical protein MTO98_09735 [Mucilaginibacter sp. SMC90]|uniref:hypothetical protein n=1 Tax=Mucilaginibacter sp. SMC90 TaxID=2929803 RepID=UPI001FB56064|nr:hypothetical protein [Mucilaginibacter sp. SMC90]UOE51358.1 hypothetical protein MTO98_09735 [Mucilaginibacter sp. SMC90]